MSINWADETNWASTQNSIQSLWVGIISLWDRIETANATERHDSRNTVPDTEINEFSVHYITIWPCHIGSFWFVQHRIQAFSKLKLLDDHTIMAHFSFAQHHSQQRLNSQFSTAFSSAQSHSTSGTRHVLLRLRRFSPLSYVNDYRANDYRAKVLLRCSSDNQRSIYHAPINNQDSLAIINICAKTW